MLAARACLAMLEGIHHEMGRFQERDLHDEVRRDLAEMFELGLEMLDSKASEPAEDILATIEAWIENLAGTLDDPDDQEESAVALGCVWGNQICRTLNWTWVRLVEVAEGTANRHDEQDTVVEHLGVASADRRYVTFPTYAVRDILKGAETCRILFQFALLTSGRLPPAEPGDLVVID